MASLEKISEAALKPGDVRGRWRVLTKLFSLYNALLNCTVVFNTGKNQLTISDSNAMLELDIPTSTTATIQGFTIADASTVSTTQVSVSSSLLGSVPPTGMLPTDTTPFLLTISGIQSVCGKVTINTTDGTFTGSIVAVSGTVIDDPAGGVFYIVLGQVKVVSGRVVPALDAFNQKYGPIGVQIGGGYTSQWACLFY